MKENNQSAGRRITALFVLFLAGMTIFTFAWCRHLSKEAHKQAEKSRQEEILALNEIEKLTETEGKSPAAREIHELSGKLSGEGKDQGRWDQKAAAGMYLVFVLAAVLLYLYIYRVILRPFGRLSTYASQVAKGNLDIPLKYERTNLFGAFTWAFDHMRTEIKKARRCEREAVENNKTVIATLSHDIKTPIASIRAYAEGLEANLDAGPERRARYLQVMMKKCDEVTRLTNDLFLHSLSDMERLQIQKEPVDIKPFVTAAAEEMSGGREDIKICGPLHDVQAAADPKRLAQVLENLINNARKYAPDGEISLWTELKDAKLKLHIKDEGKGLLPEDMPFIFDKFYRGKNAGDEPGAGLGLYIVKYIMEQMDGSVRAVNREDGLEMILSLPVLMS